MKTRKIGEFILSHEILEIGDKETLKKIFGKMIILRAESHYDLKAIKYIAYCDEFDEIQETESIPYYQIKIEMSNDKPNLIKFIRQ